MDEMQTGGRRSRFGRRIVCLIGEPGCLERNFKNCTLKEEEELLLGFDRSLPNL